jgi:murein DD-endopeptidase MepM/ murein hydrolase activator NlpD
VNPKKKDLIRIRREQAEIAAIYKTITEQKHWDGPFALPIQSPVTSIFGTRRLFNGHQASFHQGLDLKAPEGSPIRSAAAGIVVLSKDLFFTGNTVLIDHGYGIFTIYAHLSKLGVAKGQAVKAGDLLGLSGATGRVSGPHLHWGAVIHRAKVNPSDLLKIMP